MFSIRFSATTQLVKSNLHEFFAPKKLTFPCIDITVVNIDLIDWRNGSQ